MSFFKELKRRNVVRVGIAYVVASWLLLQLTEVLTELLDVSGDVGKIVIILLIIGFPVALIFAWAFEMTPEGIKREKDVDRSQSIVSQTGRKLDRVIIGVLTIVIVFLVLDRFVLQTPDEAATPATSETPAAIETAAEDAPISIAVLPFVNMSSDPEQEFFSDGISEEILNVLTRIPEFRVAARTSSFQFKGQNQDIAKIAAQLNVTHVLEGSVRKAGQQLRITAQLIEAANGYHLWSATFDRQLEDVFAIQDEISGAIASQLRTQLTDLRLEASTPVDLVAYERYLKGMGLVATRGEIQLLAAIDELQSALQIAPDYAPAMATLARAYAVLPWFSTRIPFGEAREQTRQWSERALQLDPNNDEAMAALSIVKRESDLDSEGAEALLERALEVNPGSLAAHNFLGDLYTRAGAYDQALVHELRAAELDPLGPVHFSDLATLYALSGEYEKAIEASERALDLSPLFQNALNALSDTYFLSGDVENLQVIVDKTKASSNQRRGMAIMLHVAKQEYKQARALVAQGMQRVENGTYPASLAAFDAVVAGDFDTAGRMLLLAHEGNEGIWTFPSYIRLPEQAPDSVPWQEFWALPGPARLAELRRANGMEYQNTGFGEGRQ